MKPMIVKRFWGLISSQQGPGGYPACNPNRASMEIRPAVLDAYIFVRNMRKFEPWSVKRRLGRLLRIIPAFRRQLDRRHLGRHLRQAYPVEYALYKGTHASQSSKSSILHFTVNKAATQYVKKILFKLGEENGMHCAAPDSLAFNSGFPSLSGLRSKKIHKFQKVFKPKGYVYSSFNGAIPWIENLHLYRIIVFVRDPRDVITSLYYSLAYSHPLPSELSPDRETFIRNRKQILQSGIDGFAIQAAESIAGDFRSLISLIGRKAPDERRASNILITRYEQMVQGFDDWLDEVIVHCDLMVSDETRSELAEDARQIADRFSEGERQDSHLRKGRPGDYLEKLKPKTVSKLNAIFDEVLLFFEYRR